MHAMDDSVTGCDPPIVIDEEAAVPPERAVMVAVPLPFMEAVVVKMALSAPAGTVMLKGALK